MSQLNRGLLAAVGSTGNNTHPSASFDPRSPSLVVEFEITAIGAAPTVTYKVQGSLDDQSVPDASSGWFDVQMTPYTAPLAPLSTDTKTVVGVFAYNLQALELAKKLRLVTSANTNVTYTARVSHVA